MKPRVDPPSPESQPGSQRKSDASTDTQSSEPGSLARIARFHVNLLGHGTRFVRRGLDRVPASARGFFSSFGRRRPQAADADAPKRGSHRLVWDFAVVTAAAAMLLVVHHQFKRPHRSASRTVAAAHDAQAAGPTEKSIGPELNKAQRPPDATGNSVSQAATDGPQAVAQSEPSQTPPTPAQKEPAPSTASPDNSFPNIDSPAPKSPSEVSPSTPVAASTGAADKAPQSGDKGSAPGPAPALSAAGAASGSTADGKVASKSDGAGGGAGGGPSLDGPSGLESGPQPTQSTGTAASPASKSDDPFPKTASIGGDSIVAAPTKYRRHRPAAAVAAASTGASAADNSFPAFSDTPADHSAPKPADSTPSDAGRAHPAGDPLPPKDTPVAPKTNLADNTSRPTPAASDGFPSLNDPPVEKREPKTTEADSKGGPGDLSPDLAPQGKPWKRKRDKADSVASGAGGPTGVAPQSEPAPEPKQSETKTPEPKAAEPQPSGAPALSPKPEDSVKSTEPPLPQKPAPADVKQADDWPTGAADEKPSAAAPHKYHRKRKPVGPATESADPSRPADSAGSKDPSLEPKPSETKAPGPSASDPSTTKPSGLGNPAETPFPAPSESPSDQKKAAPFAAPAPPALAGPAGSAAPAPTPAPTPAPAQLGANPSFDPNVLPAKSGLQPGENGGTKSLAPSELANARPSPAAVDSEAQPEMSIAHRLTETGETGNAVSYKVIIRNNGSKPVKRFHYEEQVPKGHVVQATDPSANVSEETLHWDLQDFGPHEERTIAITLAPPRIEHTALAPTPARPTADTAGLVRTNEPDKGPAVELELIAPAKAGLGTACRIGFRATNHGPKTSDLKLNLDLPAALQFKRGQQLEYHVGSLDENESREDYLTAVAATPGAGEIRGEIVIGRQKIVAAKAVCRISATPLPQGARQPAGPGAIVPAGAAFEAPTSTTGPCNCGP